MYLSSSKMWRLPLRVVRSAKFDTFFVAGKSDAYLGELQKSNCTSFEDKTPRLGWILVIKNLCNRLKTEPRAGI